MGNVNFDDWRLDGGYSIPEGHTGVGQSSGIQNDAIEIKTVSVQRINQLPFVVGEEELDLAVRIEALKGFQKLIK